MAYLSGYRVGWGRFGLDKGEERDGLLCSAGARWAQVCSFALCPSLPALSRPSSPSFVFSSEPVLGVFHLCFSIFFFSRLFFLIRLDSTRASGWRLACTHQ